MESTEIQRLKEYWSRLKHEGGIISVLSDKEREDLLIILEKHIERSQLKE